VTPVVRPPNKCIGCQVNRVAWVKPRVDYCYECLPGGPFTPPSCRRCGSATYFSDGLCDRCHPGGPLYVGSCRGCLAWGVYRAHCWLCNSCRWWRNHYPFGDCDYCGRNTRIAEQRACRLCLEQARMLQAPGRALDLAGANRHGQQLFLANLQFKRFKTRRLAPKPRQPRRQRSQIRPATWQQIPLFQLDPDPELVRQRALNADNELVQYCKHIVREHAEKHGWSKRQTNGVIRSLRLLQILQDTPGAKIRATDVLQLPRYDGNIVSTLDVLAAAGLLIDDRPSRIENYFAVRTDTLPATMKAQLEVWLEVMLNGSTTPPRQRSRDPLTARVHIMGITPIIQAWAAAGHESLAEITPEQVRAALPPSGSQRNWAEFGLRSLFTTLKARKLIFTNPTRGMRVTRVNSTVPLPLDTEAIREALSSPDPAIALAVALVAFHALTANQLRVLMLTDIADRRLNLDGRSIPLADPVRIRLAAWLDQRARTWPNSINPHLFISRRSAPRLTPVGPQFPWTSTSLKPQALREDRIVQEIHATGGDVRRICDLFGLSIDAAMRYAATLDHPDLTASDPGGS
jgi:hypothetical protein